MIGSRGEDLRGRDLQRAGRRRRARCPGGPKLGDASEPGEDLAVGADDPDLGVVGERDLLEVRPALGWPAALKPIRLASAAAVAAQLVLEVGVEAIADEAADDDGEADQDDGGQRRRDDRDPDPDRKPPGAGVEVFQTPQRVHRLTL